MLTPRVLILPDRAAVDELKAATGESTASRAILRAVREYPDLVDQLREERRTSAVLRTALRAVADADNDLARAEAGRRQAVDQARAAVAND